MVLRGTKVNQTVSPSSIKFTILTYCVDDLVEVEEHSCVPLCTTDKPKAITKSSYDALKEENGERKGINREMGECMERIEGRSGRRGRRRKMKGREV